MLASIENYVVISLFAYKVISGMILPMVIKGV